jgi:hypothetical protein
VIEGRAQIGVTWAGLQLFNMARYNASLINIAQVFPGCPMVLVSLKEANITNGYQLRNKTVCVWQGDAPNAKLMLKKVTTSIRPPCFNCVTVLF